eukprot:3352817-Ditylum_brightwellii.AAC.1
MHNHNGKGSTNNSKEGENDNERTDPGIRRTHFAINMSPPEWRLTASGRRRFDGSIGCGNLKFCTGHNVRRHQQC